MIVIKNEVLIIMLLLFGKKLKIEGNNLAEQAQEVCQDDGY
jgi:hypothetical protein